MIVVLNQTLLNKMVAKSVLFVAGVNVPLRKCWKCEQLLSEEAFPRYSRTRCKACINQKSREWQQQNSDKYYQISKRYHQRHRHVGKKAGDKWRKQHPEIIREMRLRFLNTVSGRIYKQQYEQVYRKGLRASKYDRKVARQFRQILLFDICSYCQTKATEEIDHIVPAAKGGLERWYNLTGACRKCNSLKRDKTLLQALLNKVI